MIIDLGWVAVNQTIRIPFSTFDANGAAVTMTNFAVGDILIYKDGNTTERASTSGFTATTDFDGKTGKHLVVIDLSDNTTAGFFAANSEYLVAIDAVTVAAQTVGFWLARFMIGVQPGNMTQVGGTTQTAGDIYPKISALTFTVANQVDVNVVDWKGAVAPAMTGDAFARLGAPAGASTAADIAAVKTDTAAVKVQTDKFVFTVANQVDSNVITKTGFSLVATGLDAVVISDLAGVPTATAKVVDAIAFTFMGLRNLRTTTATTDTVANNAGATIGTAAVSDDGTTFSKGKYA